MDWRNFYIEMALKFGPALLIVTSFVAMLLGIILHAISIEELKFMGPPAKEFDSNVIIDDKSTDLLWFMQITDLHLSNRGNYDRGTDFNEFLDNYIDIIKPDAVLVTGDITDGRIPNTRFGTGPQLDEWLTYSGIINRTNVLKKTKWFDIRGNHDNFNVYRPKDPLNLYRQYSVQGKEHARNYIRFIEKDSKNYSFIGVDEVQTPGLKIPFNFIGIVEDEDLKELKKFKDLSKQYNSQYNIWFAHYPTSSIASPNEGLRNIVDGPYLCGHFHTIAGWVTKMHATQQPGFAEVELGDWKYNRRLRLAAIDHQLFSLVDFNFRQLPIALMTNPKTAEHAMPKYEPVGRIFNSTHIRVIAFSNATITNVELYIDDKKSQSMQHVKGPLYVLPWNPKDYSEGLHRARITVYDSEGKNQTYMQGFSMDNSRDEFSLGARILLRAYFKSYVMSMFFFITILCTLPMLILRFIGYRHKDTGFKRHYRGTFLHHLHLSSHISRIFWPLFIIPIWIAIGPHFVGYLVDEALGACFAWGVLIDGTFIHTGITYTVSSIYLLIVHLPITVLLTEQVGGSYKSIVASNTKSGIINFKFILYLAFTCLQFLMGTLLLSAYGAISFLTSFLFVWCAVIYAYCWYQCTTLGRSDFSEFDRSSTQEEQETLTGY